MNGKSAESLKAILSEQIHGYRALISLLQRERECLLNLNAVEIEAVSKEKDTVILKLRLLEEERKRLTDAFAAETPLSGTITLRQISELTGDRDFQSMRSQLRSLLQSIGELNAFNMILIGRSLSFVNNSMNFLGSFGVDIEHKTTGVIFSKEI